MRSSPFIFILGLGTCLLLSLLTNKAAADAADGGSSSKVGGLILGNAIYQLLGLCPKQFNGTVTNSYVHPSCKPTPADGLVCSFDIKVDEFWTPTIEVTGEADIFYLRASNELHLILKLDDKKFLDNNYTLQGELLECTSEFGTGICLKLSEIKLLPDGGGIHLCIGLVVKICGFTILNPTFGCFNIKIPSEQQSSPMLEAKGGAKGVE